MFLILHLFIKVIYILQKLVGIKKKKILHFIITKSKFFCSNDVSKRLYGAIVALSPQTSLDNVELIIGLSHAALLTEVGFDEDIILKLSKSTPSSKLLKELLHNCATDAMFEANRDILNNNSNIFICCDKGAKKGQHTHFVKIISWYSKKTKTIRSFTLVMMLMVQAN